MRKAAKRKLSVQLYHRNHLQKARKLSVVSSWTVYNFIIRIHPASTKIAKSIASFANTYGGWYIVGVITDAHNVAQSIPGFSLDECHDPIASLRDSIRLGIDPIPVFFPQVVTLAPKRAVLVVYVPGEQDTPFITRDGRIYRRVSDSSNPVPENQRLAVDHMVEQG